MTAIFDSRQISSLHVLAPGTVGVSFSRVPSALVLIHALQFEFMRQVTPVGTINGPYVVIGTGYPTGKLTLTAVVTSAGNLSSILSAYGTACGGGNISATSRDPCTGKTSRFVFGNCVLLGFTGAMSLENVAVASNLVFQFSQLWVENV